MNFDIKQMFGASNKYFLMMMSLMSVFVYGLTLLSLILGQLNKSAF